jgi:hypothetical protein
MRGAVANELFTTVRAVKMDDCKVLIGAPCVTTFATGRSMRPEDWRGVWDEFRNYLLSRA